MIYTAHTIDEIDDQNYVVVGELDIGGTARPLTLPLELLEYSARFRGVLVSDKITLEFELSLIKRESEDWLRRT